MHWLIFERTDTGEQEIGVIRDDGTVTGKDAEATMKNLANYRQMGVPMLQAIDRLMFTSTTRFCYVEQRDE